jgi:hypothetical protein
MSSLPQAYFLLLIIPFSEGHCAQFVLNSLSLSSCISRLPLSSSCWEKPYSSITANFIRPDASRDALLQTYPDLMNPFPNVYPAFKYLTTSYSRMYSSSYLDKGLSTHDNVERLARNTSALVSFSVPSHLPCRCRMAIPIPS